MQLHRLAAVDIIEYIVVVKAVAFDMNVVLVIAVVDVVLLLLGLLLVIDVVVVAVIVVFLHILCPSINCFTNSTVLMAPALDFSQHRFCASPSVFPTKLVF